MEAQRKERKGFRNHPVSGDFLRSFCLLFCSVLQVNGFLLEFFFFQKSMSCSPFCYRLKQSCLTARPFQWITHTRLCVHEDANLVQNCAVLGKYFKC